MEIFSQEPCIQRIVALVNSSSPPFSAEQIAKAFIGEVKPKQTKNGKKPVKKKAEAKKEKTPKEEVEVEDDIKLHPFDKELSYLIDKNTNYILKTKGDAFILVGKFSEESSQLLEISPEDRRKYCEELPYEYDKNYFIKRS